MINKRKQATERWGNFFKVGNTENLPVGLMYA